MATKAAIVDVRVRRGAKRTCQNEECGARFYDLNRDPITCPICGAVHMIVAQTAPEAPARAGSKTVKKPVAVPDEIKTEVGADAEGDEALVEEADDEEAVAGDDDTFLQVEEDEAPDVTAIVDAPIDPDEKS